ncbi:cobalamin-independent methionine synthase II family protein [Candidatus Parvarchaeota archaeon]|nr:cobalamin-independent methionine synthase II family protein [Candidatus Parvarchaeota archaeon]
MVSIGELETTVVGSYPRYPKLLNRDFDARWLVVPSTNLDLGWKGKENVGSLQDEAVRWVAREQERAGIDIISDGEQRRGHYVLYHCQRLAGFDFVDRKEKPLRGGTRTELVPTIKGKVERKGGFLAEEFRFAQSLTKKKVKVTLPGPLTIVDSVVDTYYGNEKELASDIAYALRGEVEELAKAGCEHIQIDEPAFLWETEKFFDFGLDTLKSCFGELEGVRKLVHICRGYPNPKKDVKAEKERYHDVIGALSKSRVDGISIEDAHENLELAVFEEFGDKQVILGCVDIGSEQIERVEKIEKRVKEVLKVVPPNRLALAPDCGLLLLKPEIAQAKLANIAKAAESVKRNLGLK